MPHRLLKVGIVSVVPFLAYSGASTGLNDEENKKDLPILQERIRNAKLELWKRGAFDLDYESFFSNSEESNNRDYEHLSMTANAMEHLVMFAPLKLGPIRETRRHVKSTGSGEQQFMFDTGDSWGGQFHKMMQMRGGADNVGIEEKLNHLGTVYGSEFIAAIEKVSFSAHLIFDITTISI